MSGASSIPDATAASGGGVKGKATFDSDYGLAVSSGVVTISLASNKGLEFSSGLATKIEASKGLTVGANGLAGVANAAKGMAVGASGFEITLEASNPSLQFASNELGIKFLSTGGLQKGANGTGVKLDGTTLSVGTDGLKVAGLPSLFTINGTAVGATITAANLDDLTDGSNADSLHVHASAVATEAPKVENTFTTATDSVAVADPIYFNGVNTVGKADAGVDAKSRVIGVIRSGSGAAPQSIEVVSLGNCASILSGATFNTPYYLQDTGGIGTSLPGAGKRVIQVGKAKNTTDLWVDIIDFGKKAA